MIAEILTTAGRNKLRTALTGFSVAWGIFIIIFLLGAGNGLLNAVVQNSGQFLDNSMIVYGGFTSKPYDGLKEGRHIELNDNDISTTRNKFHRKRGDNRCRNIAVGTQHNLRRRIRERQQSVRNLSQQG